MVIPLKKSRETMRFRIFFISNQHSSMNYKQNDVKDTHCTG